jgi:RimJ/RimL family protein N-acetyltransferase
VRSVAVSSLSLHRRDDAVPQPVPVRLPSGDVVTLRPLRHGEREPLMAVFDAMSPESRARRYLTGMVRLPTRVLDQLTDVDGHRHVAWLACRDGQPAGIARYVVDDGVAEVAVEVADEHQGLGIATALMDAVTTVACAHGVRRVRASLEPDNEPSRRLVTRIGVRLRYDDGLLEGEGQLRLLEVPRVDRGAVLALAGRTDLDCVHAASTPPQQPRRRLEPGRPDLGVVAHPASRKEPPCRSTQPTPT